jgi:hypothetical protein
VDRMSGLPDWIHGSHAFGHLIDQILDLMPNGLHLSRSGEIVLAQTDYDAFRNSVNPMLDRLLIVDVDDDTLVHDEPNSMGIV